MQMCGACFGSSVSTPQPAVRFGAGHAYKKKEPDVSTAGNIPVVSQNTHTPGGVLTAPFTASAQPAAAQPAPADVVTMEPRADGGQEWRNAKGEWHRTDGPAVIVGDGERLEWYKNGKLHRDDGPAVVYKDGREAWYQDGLLHRDGAPARTGHGNSEWFERGKLHRIGGPAMETADGSLYWYENGELHREDGPAAIKADGMRQWVQRGKLHRTDGPAIEHADGGQSWYLNGLPHRDDGPAVIRKGEKKWYQHGVEVPEPPPPPPPPPLPPLYGAIAEKDVVLMKSPKAFRRRPAPQP